MAGPSARLLDVGCGGGHFIHSLARRGIECDYRGMDSSLAMVRLARRSFKKLGLDPRRISLAEDCDLHDYRCDVAVMINVLSFNPDFRAPLERLAAAGPKAIIIRDNFGAKTVVKWERDGYLDEGFNHLKGYWNQWSRYEMTAFLLELGYRSDFIEDRRTRGRVEMVVDKPYRWSWLVARKPEAGKP